MVGASLEAEYAAVVGRMISPRRKDQGKPPQNLDNIVTVGYINKIPEDPVTGKADWVVVMYNCPPSSSCKEGIKNIHSAFKTEVCAQ